MFSRFLDSKRRVDPTPRTLDPTLRAAVHESMRSAAIGKSRQMLESEPRLDQVRTRDRDTPLQVLFVAGHPESTKAVEMIDILMEKGAVLGIHKMHVLLYVCLCGVEWEVVACLMKWNAAKGGGILTLPDCDTQGRSSLILACEGGHTRLALRLLDEVNVEEFAMQNHPFRVLEAAISTDNEMHAMAICEHPRVEAGIQARNILRYKGYSGLVHTVSTCTEHAVRRGMSDVVLLLDDLNHQKVCKAVWHCTQKMHTFEGIEHILHPDILRVAGKFLRDWRWAQVKRFFLLRYRGQDSEMATPKLQSYLLVRLPDELFCLTIDFLKPRGFRDAVKGLPFSPMTGRCECIEASFFAYPWHT